MIHVLKKRNSTILQLQIKNKHIGQSSSKCYIYVLWFNIISLRDMEQKWSNEKHSSNCIMKTAFNQPQSQTEHWCYWTFNSSRTGTFVVCHPLSCLWSLSFVGHYHKAWFGLVLSFTMPSVLLLLPQPEVTLTLHWCVIVQLVPATIHLSMPQSNLCCTQREKTPSIAKANKISCFQVIETWI